MCSILNIDFKNHVHLNSQKVNSVEFKGLVELGESRVEGYNKENFLKKSHHVNKKLRVGRPTLSYG